jgi:hypothetical protein
MKVEGAGSCEELIHSRRKDRMMSSFVLILLLIRLPRTYGN